MKKENSRVGRRDYGSFIESELRRKLDYDKTTGKFTWKVVPENNKVDKTHNVNWAGKEAGTHNHTSKYIMLCVTGQSILAHRAAWFLVYGEWPEYEIDHINHDRHDNRIENLRQVDRHHQLKNLALRGRNTSGVTGVGYNKRSKKWRARIGYNGVTYNLGAFETKEEAVQARKLAEKEFQFHENHGKRATKDG